MGTNTLAEMRTDLHLLLDSRDEVDPNTSAGQARLDRFLNWAYLRIQLPTTFEHIETQSSQTLTLVAGTDNYAVTLYAIDHIRYDDFSKLMRPMSFQDRNNTTINSGQPGRFARWGSRIYLDYNPSSNQAGDTLTIYGWATPVVLASSSAASILNTVWDEVITIGAAWRGWRSLGDQPKADTYREEYGALVNDNKSVLHTEGHIQGWRTKVGPIQDYQ